MPTLNRVNRPWIKPAEKQAEKKTDPFYTSTLWRKARAYHLALNPLCYYCGLFGIKHFGHIVDHEKPRRIFPHLEFDSTNHRTCCDHAHNIKRNAERKISTPNQFDGMMREFYSALQKHITNSRI